MAYSTSKTALHSDGSFSTEYVHVEDIEEDGTYVCMLRYLSPETTYYYAAYAELDGIYRFSDIKSFTTQKFVPESVDLGLSVKWAACNVGASSPEEYGGYYAWGETEKKSDYSWSTYKWCNGSDDSMTKYCTNSDYGTVDNKTVLDPEDDVAHIKWGGSWRMPTLNEIKELLNECTWEWTSLNGVNGQLVIGSNGNSIFLPAAGIRYGTELGFRGSDGGYWSATLGGINSDRAYGLSFHDGGSYLISLWYRDYGHTVRPVTE